MHPIVSLFHRLWQAGINGFYHCTNVKVWQKRDRQGQVYGWRVYNPRTYQTIDLSTEKEVRIWLDQHRFL